MAVLAFGCEGVNGALEAVEDVMASRERDLECLVVVVSANLTDWHLPSPFGQDFQTLQARG
jgi:hypothetical protein